METNTFKNMAIRAYTEEEQISEQFNELLQQKRNANYTYNYQRNNTSNVRSIDAKLKLSIEWLLELQSLESKYFINKEMVCIDVLSVYKNDLPLNTPISQLSQLHKDGTINIIKKGKIYSMSKEILTSQQDIVYLIYIKNQFITENLKANYIDFIFNGTLFFPLSSKKLIDHIKHNDYKVIQNRKQGLDDNFNSAYLTIPMTDIKENLLHIVWYV